jgi:hypothetical protein
MTHNPTFDSPKVAKARLPRPVLFKGSSAEDIFLFTVVTFSMIVL